MNFSAVVLQQIDAWIGEIEKMDIETVARETGFQKRSQRKIDIKDLALGVLAMVATGRLSYERVAASIARRAQKRYSKQALHKRIGPCVGNFLSAVFSRCMQPTMKEAVSRGLFSSFKRVLLHDSTTIPLPKRYASHFPGSSNQRTSFSQLKIQVVCDLLIGRVEHLSLSGFTRNDQRAAPDILTLLRPGDLIIRDLGYFVLSVFEAIIAAKAFFLSRYRHDVAVIDPVTHRPIPLVKLLGKKGFFDAQVLLGRDAKMPVRLVAVPVPDDVANERRRQLRQNRDKTLNPNKEHFYLLGWNIFVTNVDSDIWPAKQLPVIYRLRWRIETLFKAWKSHLALNKISTTCIAMIHLSMMTKLVFCAFVYRICHHIESAFHVTRCHVSILRVANILASIALCLEAAFVKMTPQHLLMELIKHHAFYEHRSDRRNFWDGILTAQAPR